MAQLSTCLKSAMLEVEDGVGEQPLGPVLDVDETPHPVAPRLVLQALQAQARPAAKALISK